MTNGRSGTGSPPGTGAPRDDEQADDAADEAADLAALDREPESPDEKAAAAEIATAPVEGSLADVLRQLAADDSTVTVADAGSATEFRAGGAVFARLEGGRASFRLRREIVSAAVRTGGASTSSLGADWVVLRPERWDRYALDRAVSWWHLARRLAGEGSSPGRT